MRLVFRTEGNHQQGMGDVWGCIALADECAKYGDEVLFVIGGGEEAVAAIKGCQYRLEEVGSLAEEQTVLWRYRPDAIVVNKLNNSPEYISLLRHEARLVVTIDDAGEGAARADLSVNVLYHVPGAITEPKYIALRNEFQKIHEQEKPIRPAIRELLITQGGSDTYGFTPSILSSLAVLTAMGYSPHCTVVLGPAFRHHQELQEVAKVSPLDLSLVHNATNMAELMWHADLAITAGGLSLFELACVGTPSVVVCAERFEVETADRLQEAGVTVNLGFGEDLDYARIPTTLAALAQDLGTRSRMSRQGKELVDGRGCERVVSLIRDRAANAVRRTP
jgi:spore coat polysaccharide biosynthesis predicted glycosyltransferase SpsG